MSENTMNMKLIKCPSCGGPIDPPGGESTAKCPYCGSSVVIPESLRKPAASQSQQQSSSASMFGMDMGSMMGYGAQWSQVVQLAQAGKKEEAVQKYMSFSSISEADARRTVEGLANSQVYDVGAVAASYAPMIQNYTDTAKKITAWSFGFSCLITGFIMLVVLLILGFTFWSVFKAF